MKNRASIYRPLQLFGLLLTGLIMNSLTPSTADAAEHIKVTSEIHLENGVGIFPSAIIRTKDGGYVVTGNIGSALAWATRVDAQGHLQWRYQIHPGQPGGSNFEGAVTLNDDSTLLCGWKESSVPGGTSVVGALTHIDKEGKVLSDRIIRPQEPGVFGNSYLKGCLPWGDGYALIGDTDRVSASPQTSRHQRYYWVIALDASGNIKWEKLIPTSTGGFDFHGIYNALGAVYVAPDQDLVMGSIRLSHGGQIKNSEVKDASSTYLIPQVIVEPDGHWKSDQRTVLSTISFNTKFQPKAAYILPNQTAVKFGSVLRSKVYYAAVEWQSPDRKQSEIFELDDSGWISDAIPTGVPGEFVMIRSQDSDIKKLGMILSFIQIK